MRRLLVVIAAVGCLVAATPLAAAQGKDPFRPPTENELPAAQPVPPGGPAAPPGEDPAVPSDGLARTGQDVDGLFAAGLTCLTLGAAIIVAARVLDAATRRRLHLEPRADAAAGFPYA